MAPLVMHKVIYTTHACNLANLPTNHQASLAVPTVPQPHTVSLYLSLYFPIPVKYASHPCSSST
jgi:hypothetical protein